mmetsp:Transcript_30020/g.78759  ORF Transcript_30020/g.78759 Transcript_30020/m.78759 type:complete len:395 (-) Transcript_30020:103-1287(-)
MAAPLPCAPPPATMGTSKGSGTRLRTGDSVAAAVAGPEEAGSVSSMHSINLTGVVVGSLTSVSRTVPLLVGSLLGHPSSNCCATGIPVLSSRKAFKRLTGPSDGKSTAISFPKNDTTKLTTGWTDDRLALRDNIRSISPSSGIAPEMPDTRASAASASAAAAAISAMSSASLYDPRATSAVAIASAAASAAASLAAASSKAASPPAKSSAPPLARNSVEPTGIPPPPSTTSRAFSRFQSFSLRRSPLRSAPMLAIAESCSILFCRDVKVPPPPLPRPLDCEPALADADGLNREPPDEPLLRAPMGLGRSELDFRFNLGRAVPLPRLGDDRVPTLNPLGGAEKVNLGRSLSSLPFFPLPSPSPALSPPPAPPKRNLGAPAPSAPDDILRLHGDTT